MKNKNIIIGVLGILVIVALSIFIFKNKKQKDSLDNKMQQIENREMYRQQSQSTGNEEMDLIN